VHWANSHRNIFERLVRAGTNRCRTLAQRLQGGLYFVGKQTTSGRGGYLQVLRLTAAQVSGDASARRCRLFLVIAATATAIPDRAGLLRIVRVIKSGIGCWVEGWCWAQWSGGRCPFSLPASAKALYATTWSQVFAWATPPLLRKRGNLTPSHATYVTQRAGPTLCRCHITYFDAYKF
jgi:hypothetical protein